MQRLIQYVLFFSLLFGLPLYSLGHVPRDTLAFEQVVQIGRGRVHYLEWHPNDQYLLADTIRGAWIYDENLQDVAHIEVENARFSLDGAWLAGGDAQNRLVLVDTATWQTQKFLIGHHAPIAITAWHPQNPDVLATVDERGELIVWDIHTENQIRVVSTSVNFDTPYRLRWNLIGTQLGVLDFYGRLAIWDLGTGSKNIELGQFPDSRYSNSLFEQDFTWLDNHTIFRIWSGDGGNSEVWDISTPRQLNSNAYSISEHDLNVMARIKRISPDNQLIAWLMNANYEIWNASTQEVVQTPQWLSSWVRDGAWSYDSKFLAVVDNLGDLMVWNVEDNVIHAQNTIHSIITPSIAWRTDGQVIVSGSYGSEAYLWDSQTGDLLATLDGHQRNVTKLTWQTDGILLATNGVGSLYISKFNPQSSDYVVRIWDTSDYLLNIQPLYELSFISPVLGMKWSPDGQHLIVWTKDKMFKWELRSQTITWTFDVLTMQSIGCNRQIRGGDWSSYGDFVVGIQYCHDSMAFLLGTQTGQLMSGDIYMTKYIWNSKNEMIWASDRNYCYDKWGDEKGIGWGVEYSPTSTRSAYSANASFAQMNNNVCKTFLSPEGTYLAGLDADDNMIVWHISSERKILNFSNIIEMHWNPNEDVLALITQDGLQLVNSATFKEFISINITITAPDVITWSPDSTQLAIVKDGVLTIWRSEVACRTPSFLRPHIGLKQCS